MKKLLSFVVLVCLVFTMSVCAFAEEISVYVNDVKVEFTDVLPAKNDDTLLIPLRKVLETAKTDVYWAEEDRTVLCANDNVKALLQIGNNLLFINNEKTELSFAPVISNNRTMVTVDVIESILGLKSEFVNDSLILK